MLPHVLLFCVSICIIWFCAGLIVDAVDRIAKNFGHNGFMTAFFVLGLLTSLGELSVAANSYIAGTPQVSTGNLVGASVALILLVVPILAVVGGRVRMDSAFRDRRLMLILGVIAVPALMLLDGKVTAAEGLSSIAAYLLLVWSIRNEAGVSKAVANTKRTARLALPIALDLGRILGAAAIVFLAGHTLVEETIYFADRVGAPSSLVAVVALSIGTNIPELTIAVRSLLKKRLDVALGNYLGSAALNTLIFGVLAVISGPFTFSTSDFLVSFAFMIVGFAVFFQLMHSKDTLTRREGLVLLGLYAAFIGFQIFMLYGYVVS